MATKNNTNELQQKKLELEIKQLKRSSWKSLDKWSGLITILATLFLAFFAYRSGIFDLEKSTLENRKSTLEFENAKLEFSKANLKKDIYDFEKQKKITKDSLRIYRDSLALSEKSLKENSLKINYLNTAFGEERNKSKNLEIEKIYNEFRYFDPYELNKRNTFFSLSNKFFDDYRGVFVLFGPPYNKLIENPKYNIDEIFPNMRSVELEKVALLSKISINKNDSMLIKFEITDTLLIPYSSPIIVYIKNANKIIYSGIYTTRRIAKVCNCKEDLIVINVKGLKPMKYEVTYGLFHQGSLIENYRPLFFFKKEQVEIK